MHIGFVSLESPYDAGRGGIAAYLRAVLPALADQGHSISLFAGSTQQRTFTAEDGRVQVHHIVLPNWHWYMGRVPLLQRTVTLGWRQIEWSTSFWHCVRQAHAREPLDVVECTELGGLFLHRVAPTVVRLHGGEYLFRRAMGQAITPGVRASYALEKRVCRQAVTVTAPSRFQAAQAAAGLGWPLERVHVVANPMARGISAAAAESRPAAIGRPVVLSVGRLAGVKGTEVLLDAVPIVRAEMDVDFVLIGPWQLTKRPEAWKLEMGRTSPDGVLWLGPQTVAEVIAWYRRASLLALSSFYESFCITALEAMAFGLPVVATAAGALPELVIDGTTGRLVPAGDAGALAQAILGVLRDPVAARRMGEAGRSRAQTEFAIERITAELLRVYQSTANQV